MHFEAGDVVRIPFPYVESNVRRYRPALIITRQPIGPDGLLIWAMMITNAEREAWPGDVPISDSKRAGLPIPSVIRTAKIATLESASAGRIGRISEADMIEVRKLLSQHLGLH